MNPSKILHKKAATKAELRQALAETLGVSVPDFEQEEKKEKSAFVLCRDFWEENYYKKKGMVYFFGAKEGKALSEIVQKIIAISDAESSKKVLNAFEMIIQNMPKWYYDNAYNLPAINGRFNQIIDLIKNGKRKATRQTTGVDADYLEGIKRDLQS